MSFKRIAAGTAVALIFAGSIGMIFYRLWWEYGG